jgi:hypothetical protein
VNSQLRTQVFVNLRGRALIGAFAASLAAIEGGQLRVGTWRAQTSRKDAPISPRAISSVPACGDGAPWRAARVV